MTPSRVVCRAGVALAVLVAVAAGCSQMPCPIQCTRKSASEDKVQSNQPVQCEAGAMADVQIMAHSCNSFQPDTFTSTTPDVCTAVSGTSSFGPFKVKCTGTGECGTVITDRVDKTTCDCPAWEDAACAATVAGGECTQCPPWNWPRTPDGVSCEDDQQRRACDAAGKCSLAIATLPPPTECAGDKVYSDCGLHNPPTCGKEPGMVGLPVCVQGCFCKRGLFVLGDECVPEEECPAAPSPPTARPTADVECTGDLVYGACSTTCTKICGVEQTGVCRTPCREGCQCPIGKNGKPWLVTEGGDKCTKKRQCPANPPPPTPAPPTPGPTQTQACPIEGQVFKSCGSSCPPTCGKAAGGPCHRGCVQGCFCESGLHLLEGDARLGSPDSCVPKEDCPGDTTPAQPTSEPTDEPTLKPTLKPTPRPTVGRTAGPTAEPTGEPTGEACPAGKSYTFCGSACPLACGVESAPCPEHCVPGCFCDETSLFELGERCVQKEECPANLAAEGERCNGSLPPQHQVNCEEGLRCVTENPVMPGAWGVCTKSAPPQECPVGKEYRTCGSACPSTCGKAPGPCTRHCAKGCFCTDGLFEHGDACVREEECPAEPVVCAGGSELDKRTNKCVVTSCLSRDACPSGGDCSEVVCFQAPCAVSCRGVGVPTPPPTPGPPAPVPGTQCNRGDGPQLNQCPQPMCIPAEYPADCKHTMLYTWRSGGMCCQEACLYRVDGTGELCEAIGPVLTAAPTPATALTRAPTPAPPSPAPAAGTKCREGEGPAGNQCPQPRCRSGNYPDGCEHSALSAWTAAGSCCPEATACLWRVEGTGQLCEEVATTTATTTAPAFDPCRETPDAVICSGSGRCEKNQCLCRGDGVSGRYCEVVANECLAGAVLVDGGCSCPDDWVRTGCKNIQGFCCSQRVTGGTERSTTALPASSDAPAVQPTADPTAQPAEPTGSPTDKPTASGDTPSPTAKPTTASPTVEPTGQPTTQPTVSSETPTAQPTVQPTAQPTAQPSADPTAQPTEPTGSPTRQPTATGETHPPTAEPTTASPTAEPTAQPTAQPTAEPTGADTKPPVILTIAFTGRAQFSTDAAVRQQVTQAISTRLAGYSERLTAGEFSVELASSAGRRRRQLDVVQFSVTVTIPVGQDDDASVLADAVLAAVSAQIEQKLFVITAQATNQIYVASSITVVGQSGEMSTTEASGTMPGGGKLSPTVDTVPTSGNLSPVPGAPETVVIAHLKTVVDQKKEALKTASSTLQAAKVKLADCSADCTRLKASVDDLQADVETKKQQVTQAENTLSEASTSGIPTAQPDSDSDSGSNSTTIAVVIAAVVVIIVVAGAAAMILSKQKGDVESPPSSFVNPVYDSAPAQGSGTGNGYSFSRNTEEADC